MLGSSPEVILSLDEIQKVPDWSSIVKFLWDEDTRRGNNIKVVATGSSALTLRGGMAESLKGRSSKSILEPTCSSSEPKAVL